MIVNTDWCMCPFAFPPETSRKSNSTVLPSGDSLPIHVKVPQPHPFGFCSSQPSGQVESVALFIRRARRESDRALLLAERELLPLRTQRTPARPKSPTGCADRTVLSQTVAQPWRGRRQSSLECR